MFRLAWIVVCSMIVAGPIRASSHDADIIGEAFSVDGEQLIYREYHFLNSSDRTHRVVYSWPNGETFAEKSVDYSTGFTTPSFLQKDQQTGELITVEVEQNAITLRQSRSSSSPSAARETVLRPDNQLVIDAGFDHFVRRHWQALLAGDVMDFAFPSVHQQTLYQLRIRHQVCNVDTAAAKSGAERECFIIEPQNWFARIWVQGIELVYQRADQRLLRYTGIANILPAGEDNRVDIRYHYADSAP